MNNSHTGQPQQQHIMFPYPVQQQQQQQQYMSSSNTSSVKRIPNWTGEETLYLVQLVNEKKEIIKGKSGEGVTFRDKKDAWLDITNRLNAAFPSVTRVVDQVEKRWHNVLQKGKKDIAAQKRRYPSKGGGPPEKRIALDPVTEVIADVIGPERVSHTGISGIGSNDVASFSIEQRGRRGDDKSLSKMSDEEGTTEDGKLEKSRSKSKSNSSLPNLPSFPIDPAEFAAMMGDSSSSGNSQILDSTLIVMKQAFEAHKECCKNQTALMKKQRDFYTLLEEHMKILNDRLSHG